MNFSRFWHINSQSNNIKSCFTKLYINMHFATFMLKHYVTKSRWTSANREHDINLHRSRLFWRTQWHCRSIESIRHIFSHFCTCSFALVNCKRCCCDVEIPRSNNSSAMTWIAKSWSAKRVKLISPWSQDLPLSFRMSQEATSAWNLLLRLFMTWIPMTMQQLDEPNITTSDASVTGEHSF